ncbi:MAG: tetratricopeptide repeat protein [Candidatus Sericytochromatia bacterium]
MLSTRLNPLCRLIPSFGGALALTWAFTLSCSSPALANAEAATTPDVNPVSQIQAELLSPRYTPLEQATLYYNLGLLQQRAADLAAAENAYQQSLQRDPDLRVARHNLALLYLQSGRAAQAIPLLQDGLARWRVDPVSYELLAHAQLAQQQPEAARKALQQALQLSATTLQRQTLQAALQSLGTEVSPAPAWPAAQRRLYEQAVQLLESGQPAAAEPLLKQALKLMPRPDIHYRLAQTALALKQLSAARQSLEATLRLAPEHGAARLALAELQQSQGQLPQALNSYRSLLQQRPGDTRAALALAQLYEQRGESAAAVREREQVQARDVCADDNPYRLARLYDWRGTPTLALPLLEQQQRCRPLPAAARLLGSLSARRGDSAAALEHYTQALKRWPRDGALWGDLGQLRLSLGQSKEATAALQQALQYAPTAPETRWLQAELALRAGRLSEGLQLLNALVKAAPRPEYRRALALAQVQAGRYPEALRELQAYLAQKPADKAALQPLLTQLQAALKQRKGRYATPSK